jgi:hypothetical protein
MQAGEGLNWSTITKPTDCHVHGEKELFRQLSHLSHHYSEQYEGSET